MSEFKTPGVYVKENNASGNSVVEVPTAVPCFIGLTGKTVAGTASIIGKPVRISSMSDYTQYFGGPPLTPFTLEETDANGTDTDTELYVWDDGAKKGLKATYGALYTLYYQMVMFFANGGGTCYVASMGDYGDYDKTFADHYTDEAKEKLFDNIEKEAEITIIVVPEAVNCEGWARIYTDILTRLCSTGRLFTILDVPDAGDANHKGPVETFRDAVGNEGLQFAAAYYPWLQSSVLSENNLEDMMVWKDGYKTVPASLDGSLKEFVAAAFAKISKNTDSRGSAMDMLLSGEAVMKEKSTLHRAMLQSWPLYRSMAFKIRQRLNLLPPSAAMAGIYTMMDNTRGVWKAPANVALNYTENISKDITHDEQQDLNVPVDGKSINSIRAFSGEGIKVWGARTLDGLSLDWRYVNLTRTMIFLEQSIWNAVRAYASEPNDANTWVSLRCMVENFLYGVWKRGGLAGVNPEDAFEVHVGLGDTMTPEDILEGMMRITVLAAMARPAEFIEITFRQQMKKG